MSPTSSAPPWVKQSPITSPWNDQPVGLDVVQSRKPWSEPAVVVGTGQPEPVAPLSRKSPARNASTCSRGAGLRTRCGPRSALGRQELDRPALERDYGCLSHSRPGLFRSAPASACRFGGGCRKRPALTFVSATSCRKWSSTGSFDLVGKQPIVLLKTADGNKFLRSGSAIQAAAILMKLQGASTPADERPVADMLEQLDAQVVASR